MFDCFERREGIIEQDGNTILHLEINLDAVAMQMEYAERVDVSTLKNILDSNSAYSIIVRELEKLYKRYYR